MKRFVDLRLCAPIEDSGLFEGMIRKAKELGYDVVGVPLPARVGDEQVRDLRAICEGAGVDLATRVEFSPRSPDELLRGLRRFRRKFEVLAVLCRSKGVARQAAKDRRVDLLLFQSEPHLRFFDKAEAELASGSFAALEIEIYPLIAFSGFRRVRLLSRLRVEVEVAGRFGVPVVLSSGASSELFMRGPRELAALASLFETPLPTALKAVSDFPLALVKRNREKLSPDYVAPGVRVVRRGRDCRGA